MDTRHPPATSFTETADSFVIAGKAVSRNFVFGPELENSVCPQLKNMLTPSSIMTAHLHTCTLKYIYVIPSVWQLVCVLIDGPHVPDTTVHVGVTSVQRLELRAALCVDVRTELA